MDDYDHEFAAETQLQWRLIIRKVRNHFPGDWEEKVEEDIEDLETAAEMGRLGDFRLTGRIRAAILVRALAEDRAWEVLAQRAESVERERERFEQQVEARRRGLRTLSEATTLIESTGEPGGRDEDGWDRTEENGGLDDRPQHRSGAPSPPTGLADLHRGAAERTERAAASDDLGDDIEDGEQGDREGVEGEVGEQGEDDHEESGGGGGRDGTQG